MDCAPQKGVDALTPIPMNASLFGSRHLAGVIELGQD